MINPDVLIVLDLRKIPIQKLTNQQITGRIHCMTDTLISLDAEKRSIEKSIKSLLIEAKSRTMLNITIT
jgi:predicted HAD superfamily phosphohydrolase YqeG